MHAKEEVIFTIIIVIFVLVFLAILFLVIVARNNTRKNKLLFENERIKKEFEKTLLHTRLEIQEQTLSHVSREIHDNIGQSLSLVRLQLGSMEVNDISQLENTDELLGKAIADLRILSHTLNTDLIKEKGFVDSVNDLVGQMKKTKRYEITFSSENFTDDLPEDQSLILFRVVQEILNNVMKHAEASVIEISLSSINVNSMISIRDNGKGFDIAKMKSNGLGLKNIEERIKIIGGGLHIDSDPGKGTTITITLNHE